MTASQKNVHAAISNQLSEKPKTCLVLYGRLTQVILIEKYNSTVDLKPPIVGFVLKKTI